MISLLDRSQASRCSQGSFHSDFMLPRVPVEQIHTQDIRLFCSSFLGHKGSIQTCPGEQIPISMLELHPFSKETDSPSPKGLKSADLGQEASHCPIFEDIFVYVLGCDLTLLDKETNLLLGLPCGSVVKNLPANERDAGLIRVRKIPWRRKWQPSPGIFLPGKSHG